MQQHGRDGSGLAICGHGRATPRVGGQAMDRDDRAGEDVGESFSQSHEKSNLIALLFSKAN